MKKMEDLRQAEKALSFKPNINEISSLIGVLFFLKKLQ